MTFSLAGKKAVITGGGSGIGRAMANLFAASGAEVHLIELSEESARVTCEEIRGEGGLAFPHICDVTDQSQVVATFSEIEMHHVLVNNAGIAHIGRADTTSEPDFDKVIRVNVKGVYNCLFASIPWMKKNGGGAILNMASVAAWCGLDDRFVYSATKGAVAAMTLSVAKDYLPDKIRCNSISPGRVHTPFVDGFLARNYPGREKEVYDQLSKTQPIGRMAMPSEVAALALYLCSDAASFITGTDYPIDGGFLKLNT